MVAFVILYLYAGATLACVEFALSRKPVPFVHLAAMATIWPVLPWMWLARLREDPSYFNGA